MTDPSGVKSVRAVERAIDVLRCFSRDCPALGVTDIQKRLGLSRPTLYRLLHTLETKGMVRSFGEPRRFALDYGAAELSHAWLGKADLERAAEPFLAELWEATDETVALFVPGALGRKLCVREFASRQPLTFTRGAGFTETMTTGSSGRVMLAYMAPDDLAAAMGDGDDRAARAALFVELDAVRRDGYSVSSGEILAGAIAIAAPIFDSAGGIAGAISVFGPEARLDGARRETCIARLRRAAAGISAALGYRPSIGAAEAAE